MKVSNDSANEKGTTVHVRGLDAIDGTPVLDLKPFMPEFGPRGDIRFTAVVN